MEDVRAPCNLHFLWRAPRDLHFLWRAYRDLHFLWRAASRQEVGQHTVFLTHQQAASLRLKGRMHSVVNIYHFLISFAKQLSKDSFLRHNAF